MIRRMLGIRRYSFELMDIYMPRVASAINQVMFRNDVISWDEAV